MNCDKPFDGHGGELAHSWTAGDVHFDEDENYKRDDPTGTGINLLKVSLIIAQTPSVPFPAVELTWICCTFSHSNSNLFASKKEETNKQTNKQRTLQRN